MPMQKHGQRIQHGAGRVVQIVDERYSTRKCSVCMKLTGPSGLGACDVRQWTCIACNTFHLRDNNGGENIRQTGETEWNLSPEKHEGVAAPRYWRPFAGTK